MCCKHNLKYDSSFTLSDVELLSTTEGNYCNRGPRNDLYPSYIPNPTDVFPAAKPDPSDQTKLIQPLIEDEAKQRKTKLVYNMGSLGMFTKDGPVVCAGCSKHYWNLGECTNFELSNQAEENRV